MLIKLLTPRLLVTASVLLAVTVGVRAPRTPIIKKRPGNPGTPDRLPPGPKDSGTQDYSPYKTVHDHYFPPTDTYDREHIHPPNPPRDSNTYTDPGFIFSPSNLPQRHRDFGTHDYSPPVELQSPGEQEYPLTDTYDVNINNLHDDIIEVQPLTNEEFKILLHDNLRLPLHVFLEYLHRYAFYRKQKFKGPRDFGTHDHSSTANNTRHDDNGKASLPIQQPEGNYAKFLEDINVAHQEMYLNKTRHDDNDKTSLPIQQPKSQSKKLLFNRMLYKIIDSLRKLANETIVVRELLKGDIPREDESKNSSEPIQNCTHHIEQIQKRMTSFKDLQKSVLDSIVDFEHAYDILRESWNTKLENMISSPNSFLRMIGVRPLREKIRTEDKLYDSSKPATTLRQALAQLYIQDHVKLEISNCTHQIDHFQKQMRLFEAQQIKVYDSITKLKYEYKLLIESWETELKNVIDRNVPIEKVYKKVYKDIQLLRSTDHEQEIIMEDTEKLDELQVSSELAMPLEKLPKRLIFLTDPFKWKHNIWQFQSNELRKSDNLTGDLKQNKWLIFKQIDPQLKRWRLVATTVPETTFGEAQGRVEPTNLGSPIMHSTWTFLGKIRWNDTNCDLQQCGWLVFNQTDPLLNLWRLVVSSPIRTEKQQNQSEPHTTLEKSHCSVVPTVPSKGNYAKFLEDINITHQEMYLNNTRHDDNDKASLVIQQPKSLTEELLFDRMSHKIIDSLRTLANETIAVQELLKGDIPQEEESQNSSKLNNTRHDDNGKASLAIQQPKSHTEESWLNQMLIKIIGSLRTSANETIAVQESIKEDIPRKEESQNSSELIQNCTHHVEQIQKRMLTFKDQQINVLESIVEFEQAYEILRVSWKTKLTNILSKTYSLEARIFLRMIEDEQPVRCPPEIIREKTRTADKLQDSSKPATTLRQALAQLYIQDHVKLEITNCTHQIDHFQKQMRLFEDQQINVYDSITELKQDYKLLIESWETELKNMTERKVPIEEVYKKLYEDIQLLRSTDHKQEIIMDYTQKLDELQVSSELVMPLEKLRKRLIFLTDPFKWEHSLWQLNSNETWKPDNLTHDLKQNKWIVFKQIDPLLKRWRLVAKTVPDITLGEARGRVEPTNSGSRMMNSTWTFLGKIRWNDTNCDLQQCGWLVFNQTDPLLNHWRLVVSSPIIIEEQQNPSEPHTTLENSHSYVVPTVPSKTASEQPKSLEILTTTTTIDPMLVDELQDPTNPFNLGQGYGNLHLSKPVVYEDMSTWNFPDQTSRVP